jgi:hypothetical protein
MSQPEHVSTVLDRVIDDMARRTGAQQERHAGADHRRWVFEAVADFDGPGEWRPARRRSNRSMMK